MKDILKEEFGSIWWESKEEKAHVGEAKEQRLKRDFMI